MSNCPSYTLDSNEVIVAIAEEECLRQLPASPVWHVREINTVELGAETTKVQREPINPSRQRKKGRIVGEEASATFNEDLTKGNLARLMQGFIFADASAGASTKAINLPAGNATVLDVDGTEGTIEISETVALNWVVGGIVNLTGFQNAANNGLKVITAATATGGITKLFISGLVDEAPDANAAVETVGYQFPAGDVSMVVVSGIASLVTAAGDFNSIPGLVEGSWIFIGDDLATHSLGANIGRARIRSIATSSITFDVMSFTPVAAPGTGVSARIYVGQTVKNERDPDKQVRRSYQIEQRLGVNEITGARQAQYVTGAVANEFTLSIPSEDKLAYDMSFAACGSEYRTGAAGDEVKTGARVELKDEEAFNSSSDVLEMTIRLRDITTVRPENLVGHVSEASITINNNVTGLKAVGVLGNLEMNAGTFEAGGSLTAYFTDISVLKHIKDDQDIEATFALAYDNTGYVFDLPNLSVDGTMINVEKDNAVTLPLEMAATEGELGHSMLFVAFSYLPNVAMPVA